MFVGTLPEVLSRKDEIKYGNRARKGNRKAIEIMATSNIKLAIKIAMEYQRFGLEDDLLVSEAMVGLMKAVEKYRPKRGKFSMCLRYYVTGAIRELLCSMKFAIDRPQWSVDLLRKIDRTAARLEQITGVTPTDEEIAAEINQSVRTIKGVRNQSSTVSLETKMGDGERTLWDVYQNESAAPADEDAVFSSDVGIVQKAISEALTDRQRQVIMSRFGLGREAQTLEQVGQRMNITRERVRQIEVESLEKIRDFIAKKDKIKRPTKTRTMRVRLKNPTPLRRAA